MLSLVVSTIAIFFFVDTFLLQEKKRLGFLSVNCSFGKSVHGNPFDVGIECRRSIRKVELSEMHEQLWILWDIFCKLSIILSTLSETEACFNVNSIRKYHQNPETILPCPRTSSCEPEQAWPTETRFYFFL